MNIWGRRELQVLHWVYFWFVLETLLSKYIMILFLFSSPHFTFHILLNFAYLTDFTLKLIQWCDVSLEELEELFQYSLEEPLELHLNQTKLFKTFSFPKSKCSKSFYVHNCSRVVKYIKFVLLSVDLKGRSVEASILFLFHDVCFIAT